MIIHCSACAKRVRIDAGKYAGKRIKLRCAGCGEVFAVDVPASLADTVLPTSRPLILVAHSDLTLCETVGGILSAHDFHWQACHDGDAALQLMDARPPLVAIVDVALPGLFAFEVVDKVRRRPGLETVKIMLLSSVYNKMAYKRRPHTLYGADDYIEKHHIPTDLITKIHQLAPLSKRAAGRGPLPGTPPNQAGGQESVDVLKDRLQLAEESESALDADERVALLKAQRLARIIVSDIALYDEAKVAAGIEQGTFFELFAAEIAEGRRHFLERIPASIPNRSAILDAAFNELMERFLRENSP